MWLRNSLKLMRAKSEHLKSLNLVDVFNSRLVLYVCVTYVLHSQLTQLHHSEWLECSVN